MTSDWIAVACADHVRRGREAGFMQVCHGKVGPLRRIRPGDRVAYYSPTRLFRGKDRLQAFTAIGVVREGEPYRVEMAEGFKPFRRDIAWLDAEEASILPFRASLEFASGDANWGYRLRLGLLPIGGRDMQRIAEAMAARLPE